MSDDVLYKYEPKVPGDFLLGVPARDLTAADVAQLEDRAKADLEGSDMYVKADKVGAEQVDPDPRAPGRTDADTLAASGPALPVTDEPVFENAPSFAQVDSSPIDATLIGEKSGAEKPKGK